MEAHPPGKAPAHPRSLRIVKNDDDLIVAFFKDWKNDPRKEQFEMYMVLYRRSGLMVTIDDILLLVADKQARDSAEPSVETQHCHKADLP